eukprot:6024660-Alexandrium_andersonii.AAC.1
MQRSGPPWAIHAAAIHAPSEYATPMNDMPSSPEDAWCVTTRSRTRSPRATGTPRYATALGSAYNTIICIRVSPADSCPAGSPELPDG